MKKKTLPKPITLLILTLLTAVVWVGLNIYRSFTIKPISPVSDTVVKPLNPTLNTGVIQKIESAIYLPDSQIPPLNIEVKGVTRTIAPTPVPVITPIASPIASPAASPLPNI